MTTGPKNPLPVERDRTPLVARSEVPANRHYSEYRQYLRYDFYHCCAYCTMSESEAQAIRFCTDHYEPQGARPDLQNEYSNLMYSCDECNIRKGDRCPPQDARIHDHRFFRPDQDVFADHFEGAGIRVNAKSNVGHYTIQSLDLNRKALQRLRDIRTRLHNCDMLVAEGVMALRRFHIDQLPQSIKGAASKAIRDKDTLAQALSDDIDSLLRSYAKSELIDPDSESEERFSERAKEQKKLQSLFPGSWRAPRKNSKDKG